VTAQRMVRVGRENSELIVREPDRNHGFEDAYGQAIIADSRTEMLELDKCKSHLQGSKLRVNLQIGRFLL
jgi:hypothetical protein